MRRISIFFVVFTIFTEALCLFAQDNSYNNTQVNNNSEIIEYLEFREVDIKDILRQLTKQYNLNIIFSESVRGTLRFSCAMLQLRKL